jgi:hypothetical protein
VLNGHLSWLPQRRFKFNLLHDDGSFILYWLALALTRMPEHSDDMVSVLKFVQVRNALAAVAFHVWSSGNMISWAHVILGRATSSNSEDGQNERWILNSHMNLAT